jgi:hypothetical protein
LSRKIEDEFVTINDSGQTGFGVCVGVIVGVCEGVAVFVEVKVGVAVILGVGVFVGVAVLLGVGVAVTKQVSYIFKESQTSIGSSLLIHIDSPYTK